jgi:hypothetical protein
VRTRCRQIWGMQVGGVAMIGLALAGTTLAICQGSSTKGSEQKEMSTQGKFYCNVQALTPAQRTQHKESSDKLMRVRKKVVEMDKGYEFQYAPADVSLAELADWVAAEAKCCPFFDFHIDLEEQGNLLCLRLTGEEGVKEFIRTEFELGKK